MSTSIESESPTSPAHEREAADRLARVHGPAELRAAILGLIVTPQSKRALRAWQIETEASPGVDPLREATAALSGAARLPWLEALLARMAKQPIAARQELLLATRRVMGARGTARPIDRLHWLFMRRALGESAPLVARDEPNVEVAEWLESDVLTVASFSAFLSRMVPGEVTDSPQGRAWYDTVMATWQPFAEIPEWHPPHADEMVESLAKMQTLSWMQRPVIVRTWVTTAVNLSRGVRLSDLSADALRLSCTLLDSPQPPELARHYIAVAADGR